MATKAAPKKPSTKKPSGKVNAKPKSGKADPVVPAPVVAQPAPVSTETKSKRERKNETTAQLVMNDPKSASVWLSEFRGRTHSPRKGYAQHWNELGMIHDGLRSRMSPQGMGRTVVLTFDALCNMAFDGDKAALEMVAFCINFGTNRLAEIKAEREAEILAEAARITAAAKAS